jgi:hypothetical protein
MAWGVVRRLAVVLLCSLTIAACTKYELDDRLLEFNSALLDNDNRQLLLNAVRSSKRYPVMFTAVGSVNSSGVFDGSTLGLTIPFGPINKSSFSANPSLKFQEGLTVATAPLDTQEFFEGFMGEVPLSLVAYYLANGWPPELVYYTFIREIDLSKVVVKELQAETGCKDGWTGCPYVRRRHDHDMSG